MISETRATIQYGNTTLLFANKKAAKQFAQKNGIPNAEVVPMTEQQAAKLAAWLKASPLTESRNPNRYEDHTNL